MKNKFNVELTPELIERAKNRLDHILYKGCLHQGVSEKFDSKIKPDWYDEERFKKAQKCMKEYYFSMNSSLMGMIIALQIPGGLAPLLATGQSKNMSRLYNRYLNTILHIGDWYRSDPFDPKSKAHRSQESVKAMHKNVAKLMNSKVSIYNYVQKMVEKYSADANNNEKVDIEKIIMHKDRIWLSQADMAGTQWAFIGLLMLEPYACGLHAATKETLIEFAYLWKVFGYRIGIEDEFNLFNELDYDLIYAICKMILERECIPNLENISSPLGYRMGRDIVIGMSPILFGLKWKSYIKFWYKKLNINAYKLNSVKEVEGDRLEIVERCTKTQLTDDERKQMIQNGYNDKYIVTNPQIPFEEVKLDTIIEMLTYHSYKLNINVAFKSSVIRNLSRKIIKNTMNRASRNRKGRINFLAKNYDEKRQYPACPFAGNIQNPYSEYSDINKNNTDD